MKLSRLGLAFALALTACQTDSTTSDQTDTTEQAIGGDFCNAKFPSIYTWDGQSLPPATGRFVLLKLAQYPGWYLLSNVDTSQGTITWARYVYDTQLNSMASHVIRAGLVGPGGGPPNPPCEITGACSKMVVALAQRVELAPAEAYEDAKSCGLK